GFNFSIHSGNDGSETLLHRDRRHLTVNIENTSRFGCVPAEKCGTSRYRGTHAETDIGLTHTTLAQHHVGRLRLNDRLKDVFSRRNFHLEQLFFINSDKLLPIEMLFEFGLFVRSHPFVHESLRDSLHKWNTFSPRTS